MDSISVVLIVANLLCLMVLGPWLHMLMPKDPVLCEGIKLLVLLLLLWLSSSRNPNRRLKRGIRWMYAGEYAKAQTIFQRIARNPWMPLVGRACAVVCLSALAYRMGEFQQSLQLLQPLQVERLPAVLQSRIYGLRCGNRLMNQALSPEELLQAETELQRCITLKRQLGDELSEIHLALKQQDWLKADLLVAAYLNEGPIPRPKLELANFFGARTMEDKLLHQCYSHFVLGLYAQAKGHQEKAKQYFEQVLQYPYEVIYKTRAAEFLG